MRCYNLDAKTMSSLSESVDDVVAPKLEQKLYERASFLEDVQWSTIADLKKWPILAQLSESFISKIRVAFVCGKSGNEAFIVTTDDKVYAMGENRCGRADKPPGDSFYPRIVSGLNGKVIQTFGYQLECGMFALAKDNFMYVEHKGNVWQALKTGMPSNKPSGIVQITANSVHVYAVTDCGKLYNWYIKENKLTINVCLEVPSDIWISQVECTQSTCFILTRCGKIYTTECSEIYPGNVVHLKGLENICIDKMACGRDHTLALSRDNHVYSWGSNDYGQLGRSGESTVPTRVTVTSFGRILHIAATNSCDISVAAGSWRNIFMWGNCGGLKITVPFMTLFETIPDVFCSYATPRVMHQPLFIGEESPFDLDLKNSLELGFDDPTTSDFVVQIGSKQIHVHKAILKLRSVYFSKMFQTGWKDNEDNVLRHDVFPFDVYRQYLRYLYTDELDVSPVDAGALLPAADLYDDRRLKRACATKIARSITVNNTMYFYDIATRTNA